MSTVYTKIADKTTSWTDTSDISTSYTEISDKSTPWGLFGGLIRLCTEGIRDDMMSEGRVDYIVVSHGEDVEIWTDTSNVSSSWTKINDI